MFTGIIRELGTVVARERARGVHRLRIHAPALSRGLGVGESVAVNGVCLSAVQIRQGTVTFEVIPETCRLTTLGAVRSGDRVNLEPSLTLSDRLNGHLVLGHVDGTGRIIRRRQQAGQVMLSIRVDRRTSRYLVPKASVAVDGVSLTVGLPRVPSGCAVFLIPETLRKTTLGSRRVGERVNLEIDYIAKLVVQLLRGVTQRNRHAALDWGGRVGQEAW